MDGMDWMDGMETMWKPHENHVGPMWKPHENHVGDMCKPCANHVQTIWKPHENHVGAMWKPHENHVGDMCKPCGNHVQTMWKPHENHVGRQCPGGPKSQIPRPNQGFQMKFGWLANTWSSKNATCRGDIICYINAFYTCMICMFLLKLM